MEDLSMLRYFGLLMAAIVAAAVTVQAPARADDSGCATGCGQAPASNCAPATCTRTVWEPECTTEMRTVTKCGTKQEQREHTVTTYKQETSTEEKTCTYTVMVPETRTKTVTYNVCKPVWETQSREYNVCVPYTEQQEVK